MGSFIIAATLQERLELPRYVEVSRAIVKLWIETGMGSPANLIADDKGKFSVPPCLCHLGLSRLRLSGCRPLVR